ncbi:hypothetical protein [Paenibacillus sp. F4]|uniref:hypothetical protein n=1 Tax=Paenibacillus sp. F4 TaxID=357385 RepID=UPI000C9F2190|nr:hypothetical protein [Paenibacillus sp. F4]PNQ78290.1 hypothetical protein C1T21_25640 [Paenibacillus sp. F4]
MMVKKYGLLVIILFFVILADSIYLTDALTRFTVNSMLQYTFVLLYFFLLFSIIFCFTVIKIKKETSRSSYRKKLLFSVISAAILLVLGNSMLVNHLYKPSTLEIVASGEKNVESKSTEVWVTDIFINGDKANFDYLPWSGGWQVKDKALLSSAKVPQSLKIKLPASKDIRVKFLKHEWSGIVVIKDGGKEKSLDLYSSKASSYEYKVNGSENHPSDIRRISDLFMAFILLLSISFLVSIYIKK